MKETHLQAFLRHWKPFKSVSVLIEFVGTNGHLFFSLLMDVNFLFFCININQSSSSFVIQFPFETLPYLVQFFGGPTGGVGSQQEL